MKVIPIHSPWPRSEILDIPVIFLQYSCLHTSSEDALVSRPLPAPASAPSPAPPSLLLLLDLTHPM